LLRAGKFPALEAASLAHFNTGITAVLRPNGSADWLANGQADLVVKATPDFYVSLEPGELLPKLELQGRPDDDKSVLAKRRLTPVLELWKAELKRAKLARRNFDARFAEPMAVDAPAWMTTLGGGSGGFDLVGRVFPFMLVMWSLAGALYPAVDLCAGEKERGTMETLLITPAAREEIVMGKFLTIWIFSAGTALLNLASMGLTTAVFAERLGQPGISLPALLWCVVLALPLAALFSAIALAIGAYARSSKEGQYYLMPLFVVTMPLVFLTLVPGVELNPFYSMVPVTGVALLMQRLMSAASLDQVPWLYFLPVLGPMAIYGWLALRWAVEQFQREEVLFREAERLDPRLWLKSFFRDNEPYPSLGQAAACFTLLLGLRWLSLGLGRNWHVGVHVGVTQLAFVAAPVLFMAILLTRMPRATLYLNRPRWDDLGLSVLLALLLLPPLTWLSQTLAAWFPHVLDDRQAVVAILGLFTSTGDLTAREVAFYLVTCAMVPAICEELAFRGFLLSALHRGFRPRNAILLSAFLYSIYHMNVFLLAPAFFLGVVLGLLTVRSRGVIPALLFHFLHNAALIGGVSLRDDAKSWGASVWGQLAIALISVSFIAAVVLIWRLYRKPYERLARSQGTD
jgi:sodium transport system permease protein